MSLYFMVLAISFTIISVICLFTGKDTFEPMTMSLIFVILFELSKIRKTLEKD